ncbi:MAG: hypothetical protein H7240_04470 [Glaciimonas sp.]|nr:hypothetical protein [Glaciimonas sp.]
MAKPEKKQISLGVIATDHDAEPKSVNIFGHRAVMREHLFYLASQRFAVTIQHRSKVRKHFLKRPEQKPEILDALACRWFDATILICVLTHLSRAAYLNCDYL